MRLWSPVVAERPAALPAWQPPRAAMLRLGLLAAAVHWLAFIELCVDYWRERQKLTEFTLTAVSHTKKNTLLFVLKMITWRST